MDYHAFGGASASNAGELPVAVAAAYRAHMLGAVELAELTPEVVMTMLSPLCAAGKSRTAELVYILLRAALGDALRLRHVAANPMDAVMRPKHRQTRPSPWGPEEIQRYIIGIRGDPHRIAWLLALQCGLRRGEICGLRWSDVDLRGRLLHVCNQRVRLDDGRVVDQPPKTESGDRYVPVPDGLLRILRGAYRLGDGYVEPLDAWGAGCRTSPLRAAVGAAAPDAARAAAHDGDAGAAQRGEHAGASDGSGSR